MTAAGLGDHVGTGMAPVETGFVLADCGDRCPCASRFHSSPFCWKVETGDKKLDGQRLRRELPAAEMKVRAARTGPTQKGKRPHANKRRKPTFVAVPLI